MWNRGRGPPNHGGGSGWRGHSSTPSRSGGSRGGGRGRGRPPVTPGDWICPNNDCGNLNFARRFKCNRCGAGCVDKPPGIPGPSMPRARHAPDGTQRKTAGGGKGDWQCSMCANVNWSWRDECNICNTPREKPTEKREGRAGGFKENDNVEYIKHDSDGEMYDEFGRKKKKFRKKDQLSLLATNAQSGRDGSKYAEHASRKYDIDSVDVEDDDDHGDDSKYNLMDDDDNEEDDGDDSKYNLMDDDDNDEDESDDSKYNLIDDDNEQSSLKYDLQADSLRSSRESSRGRSRSRSRSQSTSRSRSRSKSKSKSRSRSTSRSRSRSTSRSRSSSTSRSRSRSTSTSRSRSRSRSRSKSRTPTRRRQASNSASPRDSRSTSQRRSPHRYQRDRHSPNVSRR